MASSTYQVCVWDEDRGPLPSLNTFRSLFGWSAKQTLWPMCQCEYYCLIVSVHETANHRLKSNVYDMLSAAISLDSYIMTICPGHAWSYCYFLQSWTLYSAGFVLSCCLWTIDGRRSWRLTGTHLWYACDSLCRRRTMITRRKNQWFINNVRYA